MSAAYWEQRYRDGGNSGAGSGGDEAAFKAAYLNQFVRDHGVESVVEFGCGDGRQLKLASYPRYFGLDVSPSALAICAERFRGDPAKAFQALPYLGPLCDLALSLDVIYHLVEDQVYADHLEDVFSASSRWVILYTTDRDEDPASAGHVRHRRVADDVRDAFPDWTLARRTRNPERTCDFLVYERT